MSATASAAPHVESAFAQFVAERDGERLDLFLAQALKLTRAAAQRLITQGGVRVAGKTARPSLRLTAGERIDVLHGPVEQSSALTPERLPLAIVYQDDDLLVIDKPAGIAVHPGSGRPNGTLANALLGLGTSLSAGSEPRRPGIVHRLDLDTSGLLVVARNDAAHAALARQFAERTVKKTYLALLSQPPRPAEGVIDAPIARDLSDRQKMSVREGGRHARTRYSTLGLWRGRALVAAQPETGRTHQIRVHFAAIGAPVCGDETYGGAPGPAPRMWLHAWRLRLRRPSDGATLDLEAPPPPALTAPLPDLGPLLERGRAWSAAPSA